MTKKIIEKINIGAATNIIVFAAYIPIIIAIPISHRMIPPTTSTAANPLPVFSPLFLSRERSKDHPYREFGLRSIKPHLTFVRLPILQ
jgi:hypothetical protein